MSLYSSTFYTSDLESLFSDKRYIEFMLKAESALIEAQALHGLVPASAVHVIKAVCDRIENIEVEKIKREIELSGNPAQPLVKQIISLIKPIDPEAAKYVHLGATSQDIVDTATILLIKEYINWFQTQLGTLLISLIEITLKHRNTIMMGRTLLQQARPITFGLKTAYWLDGLAPLYEKLTLIKSSVLKAQLGGAVGTTNSFIPLNVRKSFSEILGLHYSVPWHTNRLNLLEWVSFLGMINVQAGKIAKDVSLLMQTEIAELYERYEQGKGGSSTMPHKRNPVSSLLIMANTSRSPHLVASLFSVMSPEYERSAGHWHAEWEPLADLMKLTAGSIFNTIALLDKLEIDKSKMEENIELSLGLIYSEEIAFALTPTLGKGQANELLNSACQKGVEKKKHLRMILEAEYTEQIKGLDLNDLFNPFHSLGYYSEIIDEILLRAEKLIN